MAKLHHMHTPQTVLQCRCDDPTNAFDNGFPSMQQLLVYAQMHNERFDTL